MSFDKFFNQYLETMRWSSCPSKSEEEDWQSYVIPPDTLEDLKRDARRFYNEVADIVDSNPTQAGHDLWLTRNGHGAGFWDGDWPKEEEKRLMEACKKMHALDAEFDHDTETIVIYGL